MPFNYSFLNSVHLSLLKALQSYYVRDGYVLFCNINKTLPYNLLHFHRMKHKNDTAYVKVYPEEERGTGAIKNIDINTLINNITSNSSYYNNLNIQILNVSL